MKANATAHTSAGIRDISRIATDVIKSDRLFAGWRHSELPELAGSPAFLAALGKAVAARVDWDDVRTRLCKVTVKRK